MFERTFHIDFKRFVIAIALLLQGCGLLGQREDFRRFIEVNKEYLGCLNAFPETFDRYVEGKVTEAEWIFPWECLSTTITSFKQFVRPGTKDGYTQNDIHLFVSNFLVTDKPVPADVIQTGFALKAALLGSGSVYLSGEEIDRVANLLLSLKDVTARAIPALSVQQGRKNIENVLVLEGGFRTLFTDLGVMLGQAGFGRLDTHIIENFFSELRKSFGFDVPQYVVKDIYKIKRILIGGDLSSVAPQEWKTLPSTASGFLSLLLSARWYFTDHDVAFAEKFKALEAARPLVVSTLREWFAQWGGKIDFEQVEPYLSDLISRWISVDSEVVRPALSTAVARLIKAEPVLDERFIDVVEDTASELFLSSEMVGRILRENDGFPTSLNPAKIATTFQAISQSIPETDLVGRRALAVVDTIALKTPSLFKPGAQEIVFDKGLQHGQGTWERFLGWVVLLDRVLEAYQHQPGKLRFEDLLRISKDFATILDDLGLFRIESDAFLRKRFREADLFTVVADGSGTLDLPETYVFLQYMNSILEMSGRIRADTELPCSCASENPDDPLVPACMGIGGPTELLDSAGWQWVQAGCFRSHYRTNVAAYWQQFPKGIQFWNSQSDSKQMKILNSIEISGRKYGATGLPFGSSDVTTMSGVVHFVESLFFRFDRNRDGKIDEDEALRAFPTFRREISKLADIDYSDRSKLEAVFSYLVKNGEPPDTDFWGSVGFVFWMLGRPFWDYESGRDMIYRLTAVFSVPDPLPKQ